MSKEQNTKVEIKTENDIKNAIKRFMPDSKTEVRKILIEGLNIIKKQKETADKINKVSDEDFGGILPAKLINTEKAYSRVDDLIKNRLGGVRDGFKITWTLNNKKYEFDPYTGILN